MLFLNATRLRTVFLMCLFFTNSNIVYHSNSERVFYFNQIGGMLGCSEVFFVLWVYVWKLVFAVIRGNQEAHFVGLGLIFVQYESRTKNNYSAEIWCLLVKTELYFKL